MNHSLDLIPRYASQLSAEDRTATRIEALLRCHDLPLACHAISSNPDWDGKVKPFREALNQVVGSGFGTILWFVPGRLAYYEARDPQFCCILRRGHPKGPLNVDTLHVCNGIAHVLGRRQGTDTDAP